MANTQLPFFTHTIHQIVHHLIADRNLVIKRLNGIDYKLSKEEDWVPIQELQRIKWADTKRAFYHGHDDLLDALKHLQDSNLDQPVLKDHSTVYVTLHGHLQHAYYHLGQLSQLKKAIERLKKDDQAYV
jgi:hypothetical protein